MYCFDDIINTFTHKKKHIIALRTPSLISFHYSFKWNAIKMYKLSTRGSSQVYFRVKSENQGEEAPFTININVDFLFKKVLGT